MSGAAVRLGDASVVPVGGAGSFIDPATGQPAIVYRTPDDRYVAHSALCTHSGCRVGFDGSTFDCPCHGARFDPVTGDPISGPARRPLPEVEVVLGTDGALCANA